MAGELLGSIFNVKNNLEINYPNLYNIKHFDLERKHLFYGRIDPAGDAIFLEDSNLTQIYSGKSKTEYAVDFVSLAFAALRANVKSAADAGLIEKNSPYGSLMRVHKAQRAGDLNANYRAHLNNIYRDFVQEYLQRERRHEKIPDFKGFCKEFIRYALPIAKRFPITRTGYILSNLCSPFISGLMIEVARERHGTQNNRNVLKYTGDRNFRFFAKEASKVGFMVDKNAPWRLVFNLASGLLAKESGKLAGAQSFMNEYGVAYENVFKFYYRKAHLEELDNIKKEFFSMYRAFQNQFSTYEALRSDGNCVTNRITTGSPTIRNIVAASKPARLATILRPTLPSYDSISDEYWIKVLLTLRMTEASVEYNHDDLQFISKKLTKLSRATGPRAALNEINDLTKGFRDYKFIRKGSYWHGDPADVYEERRLQSIEDAHRPDRVQYSITATKNS